MSMQTLTGLKNGKNKKTFRDHGSGFVVVKCLIC